MNVILKNVMICFLSTILFCSNSLATSPGTPNLPERPKFGLLIQKTDHPSGQEFDIYELNEGEETLLVSHISLIKLQAMSQKLGIQVNNENRNFYGNIGAAVFAVGAIALYVYSAKRFETTPLTALLLSVFPDKLIANSYTLTFLVGLGLASTELGIVGTAGMAVGGTLSEALTPASENPSEGVSNLINSDSFTMTFKSYKELRKIANFFLELNGAQ